MPDGRDEDIVALAGTVAHDLNNLLTTILGYITVLLEDQSGAYPPEVARGFYDEIRKAGEEASRLSAQLLAASRAARPPS
jgi:signal transduction histidine kinase